MEYLSENFDGINTSFRVHRRNVRDMLRLRSWNGLETFIDHIATVRGLVVKRDGNVYEFEAPILLELKSKDFKRAPSDSASEAPKKEIKNKNKIENKNIIQSEAKPRLVKKKVRSEAEREKAKKIKQAYIKAYEVRYGLEPSFSAGQHNQVYNLITRVGFDESLFLAGEYPNFNDPYHLGQKHPFNLLVNQVDKVRVELRDPKRMLDSLRAKKQIAEATEEVDYDAERARLEVEIAQEEIEGNNLKVVGYDS